MAVRKIRTEELREFAAMSGFSIGDDELPEIKVLAEAMMGNLEAFASLTPPAVPVTRAVRDLGRRPTAQEDPYNSVIRWCSVKADADGPLSGKHIGLKDNIAVAGIPMTCGSTMLSDYVPQQDAVVAERILAAGGEIVAKCNLENFAWSGGGETSDFGYIRNPFDLERTAAGSSGGSGASLYLDEVDMTLGTDQGGSIRLPGAWCGTLALKATHSLIPYLGILGIDPTFDHVGPLGRTAEDVALMLSVVAGAHPEDPRQRDVVVKDYRGAVESAPDDLRGTRVGVLVEGFTPEEGDLPEGTVETNRAVRETVERLRELGAEVEEVSVPEHLTGGAAMFITLASGMASLLQSGGVGFGYDGRYWEDFSQALGKAIETGGDRLPPTVKIVALVGNYVNRTFHGSFYGRAKSFKPVLRQAFDTALERCDVLVMPTASHYAHTHDPDASLSEQTLRGWGMVLNTGSFDVTGHPALSIPAAEADGLPVGLMVVGRHFEDDALLSFARTYEKAYGWYPKREPVRS